jgi:hypothetical protein
MHSQSGDARERVPAILDMNALEPLLVQWQEGKLTPGELAQLKQLLAAPEGRAALVEEWLLDEAIYHTLRAQPDAAVTTAAARAVAAPAPAPLQTAPVPAPRAVQGRPVPARRRRFSWLVWHEVRLTLRWPFGLAAATALLVLCLHLYFQWSAAGRLTDTHAAVAVQRAGRTLPATAGQLLYPGDTLRVPADGAATLAWAGEDSGLQLAPGAELRLLNPMRGKRLFLRLGVIQAAVAPQSRWRPLRITTPHAAAQVAGTRFSLAASASSTRLEVQDGAVRFRKTLALAPGETGEVTVRGGEGATAAADAKLAVQPLTGFLSSEVWSTPSGTALADAPTLGTRLTDPAATAANPIERLRGFLTAPATGQYTFWIASMDERIAAELWLSRDANPAHKRRIAYVTVPDSASPAPGLTRQARPGRKGGPAVSLGSVLRRSASQQSAPQSLVQGQRYYVEIWHQGVGLGDTMALCWRLPGQPTNAPPQIVNVQALSPYTDAAAPEPVPATK